MYGHGISTSLLHDLICCLDHARGPGIVQADLLSSRGPVTGTIMMDSGHILKTMTEPLVKDTNNT